MTAAGTTTTTSGSRWHPGEVIVRREISWGRPVLAVPVRVVEDADDLLAVYLPDAAPLSYQLDVPWPTPTGNHPWWPRPTWESHGCLMLQRPGEAYAIWHFWDGPNRTFSCWYVNLQEPFRRTPIGIDTQDLELDIVILPDGSWTFKDEDKLDAHVLTGRFTRREMDDALALGARLGEMIDAGATWWDPAWAHWTADPSWGVVAPVPAGWERAPW